MFIFISLNFRQFRYIFWTLIIPVLQYLVSLLYNLCLLTCIFLSDCYHEVILDRRVPKFCKFGLPPSTTCSIKPWLVHVAIWSPSLLDVVALLDTLQTGFNATINEMCIWGTYFIYFSFNDFAFTYYFVQFCSALSHAEMHCFHIHTTWASSKELWSALSWVTLT